MKLFTLLITMFLATICQAAPQVYGDKFASGHMDTYVEQATRAATFARFESGPQDRGQAITTTNVLTFKTVPVDANTRYRLSFVASTKSSETIEDNPRLSKIVFSARSFMPSCSLRFYDKDAELITSTHESFTLPYAKWHDYQWVFYPPASAVSMQWVINPSDKDNTVTVADASLKVVTDKQSLNINPTFNMGPYNLSGWDGGSLRVAEDGQVLLVADYYAISSSFPLTEPGTYRLTLNASNFGRYNAVFLIFLDAKGKEISRYGQRPGRTKKERLANPTGPHKHEFYLTPPAGTVRGNFLIYQSLVQEISLVRVGDEQSFDTFKQK